MQFNYLLYTFSNQIANTYTTVEQNRCKLQNRLRYDTFEHLEGDRFVKDLGDSLAVTTCKKTLVSLSQKNNQCFQDVSLTNGFFLDKQTHVIKFNSSSRPCFPRFPESIIKTLEGDFVAQEPTLHSVQVFRNFSILGNLSHNKIDYLENDQGLATEKEWASLAETIQYSGLKSMLAEDLQTSLCLNTDSCNNLISGPAPNVMYNPTVLHLPTKSEIEHQLLETLGLSYWERFMKWVEKEAAYICVFTLFTIFLMFFLTIIDFFTDSNEANMIRVFIKLIIRLTLKLTNCVSSHNICKRKRTIKSPKVKYTPGTIQTIELQDLSQPMQLFSIKHET